MSKVCNRQLQLKQHEHHRNRIKNMKPTIDTSEPIVSQMDHIRNNLKKEQMLEERYAEIDRSNRILLKKMSEIMRTQSLPTLDRANEATVSLNRDGRKKELLRITKENQSILKRIQDVQPVYNHVKWEENHRRNQSLLQNCCEYPLVLKKKKSKASIELLPIRPGDGQQSPSGSRTQDAEQPGGEESLKYVLKEGKTISGTFYLIEMSTDGRSLTISVYDGDTQTTLELVVKEKNHRKVYRECNGDYSLIAQRLRVVNNRLICEGLTESPKGNKKKANEEEEQNDDAGLGF
eukprot:gnl/TRDRNA2_/TRDRNA2_178726_c0_seq1.p1 gnl/TRDRNA2_/TRDRNA2_178726_c0~~gnl/TRDRNA2_/TRDRNA2_178726_c0_seq1.p1  ORF type:complete len:291 (-),score=67.82 gnl/TRDRNA2_/TRDRNA2_178726_c0_seq1:136-1008(-)